MADQEHKNNIPGFSDEEMREIADQLGIYVERVEHIRTVKSGKSGSDVFIVDVITKDVDWRNNLFDALLEERQQFGQLAGRLGYPRQRDADVTDEIVRLVEDIDRGTAQTNSGQQITYDKLVDAFLRTVPPTRNQELRERLERGPEGLLYLKVHRDASNQDNLEAYQQVQQSFGDSVPPLVKICTVSKRLLAFYEAAHGIINPQLVLALYDLIKTDFDAATRAMNDVARWLKRFTDRPTNGIGQPSFDVLRHILGGKRWQGDESVQARTVNLLTSLSGFKEPEAIRSAQFIAFDNHEALPNPIAYLDHADYWTRHGLTNVVAPIGRSHGDLHNGNILCLYNRDKTSDELANPEIIDFGDYREDQVVFFDLLYLELDTIIQGCPPSRESMRPDLYDLVVNYLMCAPSQIALPRSRRGLPQNTASLLPLLEPLRARASELIENSPRMDEMLQVFWLTAVAVGLNYARKRTLETYEKLFSLIYAAAALRNVLTFHSADLEKQINRGAPALRIPWTRVEIEPPRKPQDEILPQLAESILNGKDVLFILSPSKFSVSDERILNELNKRLGWILPNTELFDQLADAMQKYRDTTSDLNLREAFKRLYDDTRAPHPIPFLKDLVLLALFSNVRFVLFDWDDQLDQEVATRTPPDKQQVRLTRVFHLYGSPGQPNSLCHPDQFSPALGTIWDTVDTTRSDVRDLLLKSHVVFLGEHKFEGDPYEQWQSRLMNNSQRAPELNAWHIVEEKPVNTGFPVTVVEEKPEEFLKQLANKLNVSSEPGNTRSAISYPLWEGVNQTKLTDSILRRTSARWMIYSLPGHGRSATLRLLTQRHNDAIKKVCDALGLKRQPVLNALIDLTEDPNLSANVMCILHLLFDRFELPIPECDSDSLLDIEGKKIETLTSKLIDKVHTATVQDMFAIIALDSVESIVANVEQWISGTLNRALGSPEDGNLPSLLLVTARRLNLSDEAATSEIKRLDRKWKGFQIERLHDLDAQEISEMLQNYVRELQNCPTYQGTWEYLRARVWSEKSMTAVRPEIEAQAQKYLKFCHENLHAVRTLIEYHVEQNLVDLPDFPRERSGFMDPCRIEVIYRPVAQRIEDAVYHLFPSRHSEYITIFNRLLMCYRLRDDIVREIVAITPADESPEKVSGSDLLPYLTTAEFFYCPGNRENYYQVSLGLHGIVLDHFFYNTDLNERKQFEETMRTVFELLDAQARHSEHLAGNRHLFVLDATYYYNKVYEYDKHWVEIDNSHRRLLDSILPNAPKPAELLYGYLKEYQEIKSKKASSREVLTWLLDFKSCPPLPQDIFDETEKLCSADENTGV